MPAECARVLFEPAFIVLFISHQNCFLGIVIRQHIGNKQTSAGEYSSVCGLAARLDVLYVPKARTLEQRNIQTNLLHIPGNQTLSGNDGPVNYRVNVLAFYLGKNSRQVCFLFVVGL